MNEFILTNLSLVILFLPIIGFFFTLIFGKRIKKMYYFELFIIVSTFALTVLLAFSKLAWFTDSKIVSEFSWINIKNSSVLPNINIDLGIMIDNMTVLLMFVVALISMLVHIFSIVYMHGDKRYNRYFAYLGLFTFSMNGIVFTHNILMMYIFWELVGISSYLLIGFWYEKKSASDASKKAFLVNRIGDIGMFGGILMLFTTYHTFTFDKIFAQISAGVLPFNSEFWLTVTGLLIFCGAVGKSAQFPLHVWLPDAMEGPTPVSALIHAATMVAAGVYLVARVFVMLTGDALFVIACIGAISAFIPATIALTQKDIKKVLAYSTVSQLGYMIMSLGLGAFGFAFFHLITHAFFKACLFLGSGSVIHGMHHEQDITKMGGLRKKMPLTYATFLMATLAISGVPLTSGFLSKDGILAGALTFGKLTGHWLFPFVGYFVAALTAFYMFRLVIITFHGQPADKEKYDHAHESPASMVAPLVILAGLSVFFWYTPNPISSDAGWFIGKWVPTPHTVVPNSSRYSFMVNDEKEQGGHEGIEKKLMIKDEVTKDVKESVPGVRVIPNNAPAGEHHIVHSEVYTETMHSFHYIAILLSVIIGGLGILLAFVMYQWKKISADKLAESIKPLYTFSLNKWYFDELYASTFVAFTMGLSKLLFWFDANIVDGIVNGSAAVTRFVSRFSGRFDSIVVDGAVNLAAYVSGFIGIFFRKFQTGKVQTYLIFVVFSLVILLFLFKSF